jgi:hypothetical protein
MAVVIVAIGLGKSSYRLAGFYASGRGRFEASDAAGLIGCAVAHHLGREFAAKGH